MSCFSRNQADRPSSMRVAARGGAEVWHRRLLHHQDGVRHRLLNPIAQPDQPRIECLDSEQSQRERRRPVTPIPIMRSSISQTGMNQEA
jgi:hypothetical protein